MMMIIPATTLNVVRRASRNLPTHAAEAPSVTNTKVSPTMKATELRMILPMSAALAPPLNSSIDAPDSIEM